MFHGSREKLQGKSGGVFKPNFFIFEQYLTTYVREGLEEFIGETNERNAHVARLKCPDVPHI